MAVNKPVGDNARKGAVKKRTQRKTAVMGKPAWTKRDKTSGEFMAVKKERQEIQRSPAREVLKQATGSSGNLSFELRPARSCLAPPN